MPTMLDRRGFSRWLVAVAAGLTGAAPDAAAQPDAGLSLGTPTPFSFETLKATARELAHGPYRAPRRPAPEIVKEIGYKAWGEIKFRTQDALFVDGPGRFPVTFFHLGQYFQKSVEMHVVAAGQARPIVYEQRYFDMPRETIARKMPENAGFSGFRLQEARDGKLDWRANDWTAFLGASYFRAIGGLYQYGMSARGAAIDVATAGRPEEFPDFTKFYIEQPSAGQDPDTMVVHALLDGPSLTGAYRFVLTRRSDVVMDIEQVLFLRADVHRFGLTPLTSMYWFSETTKNAADWRPEVHDSDGLAIWTGRGERLWRPLNNPAHIRVSAFGDEDIRGFGLLQRDRAFDHYLDGVFYDRRPSLWVEPLPGPDGAGWGKGAVELVEIPTDDEINDNIVAMWVPAAPARAGSGWTLRYRMHWVAQAPFPSDLARCVATRLGNGGHPGEARPQGVRKFVVEFLGAPLERLAYGVRPEAVVTTSRGQFSYVFTEPVPDGVQGHWRASFDLSAAGKDPVEMRCFLRHADAALTETWTYQYLPA